MKKKLFFILIAVLAIFIFPKVAYADDVEFTIGDGLGNDYNVLEGEYPNGVTYDSNTNTLTLDNFSGEYITIANIDTTIELKGDNTLSNSHDSLLNLIQGDFIIKGNGTLNIDANEDSAIYVIGNLTINGGTINVSNASTGIAVYDGDFTLNGGIVNIVGVEVGIVAGSPDGTSPGKILLNGGELNIEECEIGIFVGSLFKLNGTSVLIDMAYFGVYTEDFEGSFEFEKGKIIIQNIVESGGVLVISLEDEYAEEMIKFNGDNLYIDNPDYDFRVVEIDQHLFIIIGPEDTYYNAEDDNNIAKEVSILPKEKKNYKVVEGDKQTFYQKADNIKIDADLDKFVALYINDELVDGANYELESGSTIIKLKEDYTKKLSAGNYKFKVVFTDGVAEGEFTVTTENPETSDGIICTIVLLVVALSSLVTIKKYLEA